MSSRLDRITDWDERASKAGYQASILALSLGVSSRHLDRYLLIRFGVSTKVLLCKFRMDAALRFMNGAVSVKEIAYGLGFHHSTHFCRAFKRTYGCSPAHYLNSNHSQTGQNVRFWSQMSDPGP